MILTGKAKKEFQKWYKDSNSIDIHESDFSEEVFKTMQNALIINWFDSIGKYINAIYYYDHWRPIIGFQHDKRFKNRCEAIKFAIEEANRIYNL